MWMNLFRQANREITRMDIFLSLVQLLQGTTMGGISSGGQPTGAPDGGVPVFSNYQKSPMPLPISLADRIIVSRRLMSIYNDWLLKRTRSFTKAPGKLKLMNLLLWLTRISFPEMSSGSQTQRSMKIVI
ncbi:uncharacterized protein LOC131239876 [Magnolia sinica]|uniref:uncharacterized protein LOC131239876 n=1 Tax=Magnolia sinica TaxID=86752 RepID=UPI00265ABB8C|nr:uncharacterized protein LOC131239876 [Magnolia sinica]